MIAVIGAMEEEVAILRNEMRDVRVEKHACFEFFVGKLCEEEVVLLRCGVGKVQAAVGCSTLIGKYAPRAVINTGSAGGVNPAGGQPLRFGDAVVSSSLAYHDVDVTAFGYAPGQLPGQATRYYPATKELVEAALEAVRSLKAEGALDKDFTALAGLICSGDAFIADTKKVLALEAAFPGLRAVEMEGAAIAHACAMFDVPFVALRCLSDIAGEESIVAFDEYLPAAARNSSAIVKRLVKNIRKTTFR
ncbi:MAG: 5'-methylthioadenosine/adenosylhomocysteine nucleosidase [Spirochaetaceae bacterium]|jgi:adenosylhomocysteine nucleosidase|nr:5'-methylthioadenosine/adenosylhomocysteine nucleosidase [Spirochaetaceae bacterium]